MAQININVNGRPYAVGCEDGQENHLMELARIFDRQVRQVSQDMGQLGETRLFLMGSLLLADELMDLKTRLSAAQRAQKAAEMLELVGMGHRAGHVPAELSVGERQRVAIARALANGPVLLLADEPTGNLDSKTAAGVFDLFERLHREHGMTIVLVTHDPGLAARTQRIVRMQDGRIVPAEIFVSRWEAKSIRRPRYRRLSCRK